MKTAVLFWALCLAARTCFATEPSGEFVELHSCDLYTGGCTASSESTLLGRQLLRVWAIRQGKWNRQDLADLKVAVLEVGSGNLAEKESLAEKAEIYVPKGLDSARREALLSWVTSQGAVPASTRVLEGEISYERSGAAANIAVGDSISLSTMTIAKCGLNGCGQVLWYEPQARHSSFEVVASRASRIQDAALNFLWTDHDRPNVFLASFGPGRSSIQVADSCH